MLQPPREAGQPRRASLAGLQGIRSKIGRWEQTVKGTTCPGKENSPAGKDAVVQQELKIYCKTLNDSNKLSQAAKPKRQTTEHKAAGQGSQSTPQPESTWKRWPEQIGAASPQLAAQTLSNSPLPGQLNCSEMHQPASAPAIKPDSSPSAMTSEAPIAPTPRPRRPLGSIAKLWSALKTGASDLSKKSRSPTPAANSSEVQMLSAVEHGNPTGMPTAVRILGSLAAEAALAAQRRDLATLDSAVKRASLPSMLPYPSPGAQTPAGPTVVMNSTSVYATPASPATVLDFSQTRSEDPVSPAEEIPGIPSGTNHESTQIQSQGRALSPTEVRNLHCITPKTQMGALALSANAQSVTPASTVSTEAWHDTCDLQDMMQRLFPDEVQTELEPWEQDKLELTSEDVSSTVNRLPPQPDVQCPSTQARPSQQAGAAYSSCLSAPRNPTHHIVISEREPLEPVLCDSSDVLNANAAFSPFIGSASIAKGPANQSSQLQRSGEEEGTGYGLHTVDGDGKRTAGLLMDESDASLLCRLSISDKEFEVAWKPEFAEEYKKLLDMTEQVPGPASNLFQAEDESHVNIATSMFDEAMKSVGLTSILRTQVHRALQPGLEALKDEEAELARDHKVALTLLETYKDALKNERSENSKALGSANGRITELQGQLHKARREYAREQEQFKILHRDKYVPLKEEYARLQQVVLKEQEEKKQLLLVCDKLLKAAEKEKEREAKLRKHIAQSQQGVSANYIGP